MNGARLIYDGDCGFCHRSAALFHRWAGGRVALESRSAALRRRPALTGSTFRSVVFEGATGEVLTGAHAVYAALAASGHWPVLERWYRRRSIFRALSDGGYRVVSAGRPFLSRLADALFGPPPDLP